MQRTLLLLLVLIALIGHVATRYQGIDWGSTTSSISALSVDAKHQHLDTDALQWTHPVSDFALFVASVSTRHVPPAAEPFLNVHLDESLYNRPPPSC